jgi:hypothetical protein
VVWTEVFAVFLVSHLVGDFAFQTEWQARHKRRGLGHDAVSRRALMTHVSTYMLAFIPAFAWLWDPGAGLVLAAAGLLFTTHLVQDDGRLLDAYLRRVKHTDPRVHPLVAAALDQTFHVVVLFGLAILVLA